MITRDEDLGADRFRALLHQRQQTMRCGAGDDFELSMFLKLSESANDVASVGKVRFADLEKARQIEFGERPKVFIPMRSVRFFVREVDQFIEITDVTILEQRIEQHRAEGRRHRDRQTRFDPVLQPPIHHMDERDVSFGDGFKEPIFLEEAFVLRMPHIGQMRVQDDGKVSCHDSNSALPHGSYSTRCVPGVEDATMDPADVVAHHRRNEWRV
jgi:hypothetical protein